MNKNRLEAFSDGVLAILITIMVLELKVPAGIGAADLCALWPIFLSYILSFIYIGIYWNNHHHLFQAAKHVSGSVLWANLHLLFWLSLVPFVTAWSGETQFKEVPVAAYGVVLMMAGVAYYILVRALIATHGEKSNLAIAIGSDEKGRISVVFYALAIGLAFVHTALACALYIVVACIWLIPDRRIEKVLSKPDAH